jgi:putative cell wall-binding protein
MFSLKINFEKSAVILVGGDNSLSLEYADTFNCQIGIFLVRYLGVPISSGRLHAVD